MICGSRLFNAYDQKSGHSFSYVFTQLSFDCERLFTNSGLQLVSPGCRQNSFLCNIPGNQMKEAPGLAVKHFVESFERLYVRLKDLPFKIQVAK